MQDSRPKVETNVGKIPATPIYMIGADGLPIDATATATLPTVVSRSGVIAAANTGQLVAAANPDRRSLTIINNSDTDMRLKELVTGEDASDLVADDPDSVLMGMGDVVNINSANAVAIICAAAGKAFYGREG